jgi:nitroreductase
VEAVSESVEMSEALERLLTRHSVGPKHLVPPAPGRDQLWLAALAALRAPDHQKLVPFRFAVIPGEARPRLADLFADFARREGKTPADIQLERDRAMLAPALVACIARLDPEHPRVPSHEQWIAVGGAISNFLLALHAMGYGAKMLSGRKAKDSTIAQGFCGSGETLVGWIAAGTPAKMVHPRHNDNPDAVLGAWGPRA